MAGLIDKFAASVAADCGTLVGDDDGRRVEIDPISVITVVLPMVVQWFQQCREKRRQKQQEQQDTPQQQIQADHNNPKARERNETAIAKQILGVCANGRREEIKRARQTKLPADLGRWSITRASAERMAAKIHSRAATMPPKDAEALCASCGVT